MLVCERLGCPEGAAQFAQAAVHHVDAAYSNEGANDAARQAREGRLWTNLFVYYLEAGRVEVRQPVDLTIVQSLASHDCLN